MNLNEWKKNVFPGRRVYIVAPDGTKVSGIAANLYSAKGTEHIVKFSDGRMVFITDTIVQHFQLEPLN